VYHFLSKRRTSLIIDGKKANLKQVDSDILQGLPISPLLFLVYTSLQYKKFKKADVHVIGFFDDITIYTGSRDVDKNTEKLKNVLHVITRLKNVRSSSTTEIIWDLSTSTNPSMVDQAKSGKKSKGAYFASC
jgi:hypothetical protein